MRLLLALLLVSCASPSQIERTEFKFSLELVDSVERNVQARATWDDSSCHVVMNKTSYPQCLEHELIHCIEGHWHIGEVECR